MRSIALSAAALLLPLALVACGSDDDVATDPTPTGSTTSATPSPTASPTVGTYPEFGPTDYTYTLTVQCFCAGSGAAITVTVADGEVTDAAYAADDTGRGGGQAGEPADQSAWLTINDIIDHANDTDAYRVTVDWPAGQDYPNSVFVDQDKLMADEEAGWSISDVQVA